MKKLMVTALLLSLYAGSASAQKASAGDLNVEGQFSLWGPTQVVAPIIRARYFVTDDLAARVQLGFFTNNVTTNFAQNPDGTGGAGSNKRTNSMFDVRLGVEKHLAGTDKFSPYLGAELRFASASAKEEWSNSNNGNSYTANDRATRTGGWVTGGPAYTPGTTFGVNLLVGADYYVFEKLYIGAEFGYGFNNTSTSEVVTETSTGGVTNKTTTPGGSMGGLGMYNMNGGMRIGLKF